MLGASAREWISFSGKWAATVSPDYEHDASIQAA
jgi:hypothetical protein